MATLFGADSPLIHQLDWGRFGISTPATETNLWVGSAGATTACHYDTYGTNMVAQLHGRKQWTLIAPASHTAMYASITLLTSVSALSVS
jgi:HSPB1-associated protein 1